MSSFTTFVGSLYAGVIVFSLCLNTVTECCKQSLHMHMSAHAFGLQSWKHYLVEKFISFWSKWPKLIVPVTNLKHNCSINFSWNFSHIGHFSFSFSYIFWNLVSIETNKHCCISIPFVSLKKTIENIKVFFVFFTSKEYYFQVPGFREVFPSVCSILFG